jgi:hypothetical protein
MTLSKAAWGGGAYAAGRLGEGSPAAKKAPVRRDQGYELRDLAALTWPIVRSWQRQTSDSRCQG